MNCSRTRRPIPYALTGLTLGNPRLAGLGAAIQRRSRELFPDQLLPASYVLHTGATLAEMPAGPISTTRATRRSRVRRSRCCSAAGARVDEVEAVADIAQLLGRGVAARMLMESEEFRRHWTDVLAGILQVRLESANGLGAQDEACWGDPVPANPGPEIAEWVRDHGPLDGGAGRPDDWNMTALVESAVRADNLSVLYRAQLFPMSMRLVGASNRRAELAEQFQRTFLNRDVACLRCHNPRPIRPRTRPTAAAASSGSACGPCLAIRRRRSTATTMTRPP